jgi:hypothetical protein
MSNRCIYKVIFHNQGRVYEVYARSVSQGGLFGFVEIGDLVFGTRTSLVLDPAEEQLKSEFTGVGRSYIPMHAIVRIDEVEKEGPVKVTPIKGDGGTNVTPFPIYTQKDPGKS